MNIRRLGALCLIGLILLFALHASCCNAPDCIICAVYETLLAVCLFAAASRFISPRSRRAAPPQVHTAHILSDTPVKLKTLLLD